MKLKHTKYFVAFYVVALAMMGTPLVSIANRPELVLGMPVLLVWLLAWCLASALALVLHYNLDVKAIEQKK